MIRITKLTDIWKSKTIPQYIADSMEKQLLKLCREWLTDDIESFGAFFFAEDKNDLDNYREIGLTERIETAEPEKKDYAEMNTKMTEKYGISLSGIFVDKSENPC